MEKEYNLLLSWSKTAGDFYENIYAPVLQALPWLDSNDGLKSATKKVLGNMAFPAYEFSSYKDKKNAAGERQTLVRRRIELETIYEKMQADLRPLLRKAGIETDDWTQLTKMLPQWKELVHFNPLHRDIHIALQKSFGLETNSDVSVLNRDSDGFRLLVKLMADKTKDMIEKGMSNEEIAHTFGAEGYWLEGSFLDSLRV